MLSGSQSTIVAGISLLLFCAGSIILGLVLRLKATRQAVQAARLATEAMARSYASAPFGLAMFDKDLRYIRVNQCLAGYNGLSIEDHLGKTLAEVVPDMAARGEEALRQVLRSGQPLHGVVFEGATPAHPGVVRAWRKSVYPIFSDKGEAIGLNVAVEDITEERRLGAALRSSEQRERQRASELETIMNATPAGIFIAHDPQCLHVAGNLEGCRMLHLPHGVNVSADPRSKTGIGTFEDPASGTPIPADQLPMQVAAATGEEVRNAELQYRSANGDVIHTLINAAPLRNEQGEITGAVGAFIDVSARKLVEQALQQDSLRKDEFLATLAHELRNPLAAIQSGLEIIRFTPATSPAVANTCGIMERQLTHLTRLIDDLLDVSRIRSGKFELRKETLDARSIIHHALDVGRPYVQACEHQLEVRLAPGPLYVEGDAVRLTQVVSNLLNNAAKYTPEGGLITLSAEQQGNEVLISVSDNGIGFDHEMLPQLFNIYAQLERGKARRNGGIGIGLSLAKRIVELHGGSLSAYSAGPGMGSTFSVRLPASSKAQQAAAAAPAAQTAYSGSRRILLVDDNLDAAQTLSTLLSLAGHAVKSAYSGREAVEKSESFLPEVAFIDIGLPDMSGYEVARAMRANPALHSARLVALTGWGSEKDRQASVEAGFDFHVTKPATLDAIRAILPDVQMPGPV